MQLRLVCLISLGRSFVCFLFILEAAGTSLGFITALFLHPTFNSILFVVGLDLKGGSRIAAENAWIV